jgi:5-methylcytosine-specific restriction protein A
MARSRKDAWLRDEIILAFDLYRREGRNPSQASVAEVSTQLRSIPIEPHLADDPRFRNTVGVRMKVSNLVALDPDAETEGMSRGSRLDAEVFAEFKDDSDRLRATAEAIRANLASLTPAEAEGEDDEVDDAPEGRILTRTHRVRERNRSLVARKKADAMKAAGKLTCEGCGFDFAASYGERGKGFIECHHVLPLRDLKPGSRTRLSDLALLCANCHRMVHVRSPWLTVAELRGLLQSQ